MPAMTRGPLSRWDTGLRANEAVSFLGQPPGGPNGADLIHRLAVGRPDMQPKEQRVDDRWTRDLLSRQRRRAPAWDRLCAGCQERRTQDDRGLPARVRRQDGAAQRP